MKPIASLLLLTLSVGLLSAENTTVESPITMDQLMLELRIQGGNFAFSFDKPTYARVSVTTCRFPQGPSQTENFDTASPRQTIDLYFTASPLFVGDYPKGNDGQISRKMLIKLSDCEATAGTRAITYEEKFSRNLYRGDGIAMLRPHIPAHPEYGKEYILHWYYKKGDPYEAKATITFSEEPFTK